VALLPPTGLTASAVSPTQINLTYTRPGDAVAVDVERDGVIIATGHTGATFSDVGLQPGTGYVYRIRSVGVVAGVARTTSWADVVAISEGLTVVLNSGAAAPVVYTRALADTIPIVEGHGWTNSGTAMTWAQVKALAAAPGGKPTIIAHRGGGGDIALNNALSAVDFALAQGMASDQYMIMDGGDNWVSSDGILLNSHDADATVYMAPGGTVSSQTAASWAAQRLRAFPLYRNEMTDEAPPTTRQWLLKAKAIGKFTVPEDKDHTSSSRTKLRDLILELGLQNVTQVQSFEAADLGPAKAAGISVGLLQSASQNIGASAILTSVNGGKPDLVLYNPATLPGTDNAWVQTMIDNDIALQVGTVNRRYILDTERARVEAMGGKITIVPSDQPFYVGRTNVPYTSDPLDSQWYMHGLVTSDNSIADPKIVNEAGGGRSLRYASTESQWALLGGFARHDGLCWKTLEADFIHEAPDTASTTRWMSIQWAFADDRNFHDGSANGIGCLAFLFNERDGRMRIYNRTNSTTSAIMADTSSGAAGTRSGTALTAPVMGQAIRIRLENLVDGSGNFTGQARATRLDTGQWIMTAVGAAPVRGPYMHAGKNGTGGQVSRFANIAVTY
jgi:glycerophosphoryl diester phosphodiesterase